MELQDNECSTLHSSASSTMKDSEMITVKIEPESLLFSDEELETEKDTDHLNIDQKPNREEKVIPGLKREDIKKEDQTDDTHGEEHANDTPRKEKEKVVKLETCCLKEEKYVIEERDIAPLETHSTTSEYRYEEGGISMCNTEKIEYLNTQNVIHTGLLENEIPGSSHNEGNKTSVLDYRESLPLVECLQKSKKKYKNDSMASGKKLIVRKRPKKYECQECDKRYIGYTDLRNHINAIHLGISLECKECQKKFSDSSSLRRHTNAVHKKIKNHECQFCNMKFSHSHHLKYHVSAVHKGVKDYVCNECDKEFAMFFHLMSHVQSVHRGIKEYKCELCHKEFSRMFQLKRHTNLVHNNSKNYECQVCTKKFSTSYTLKEHVSAVHEGIKDYLCEECGKAFSRVYLLNLHIDTAHVYKNM